MREVDGELSFLRTTSPAVAGRIWRRPASPPQRWDRWVTGHDAAT